MKNLNNKFMHLTNYSINKRNADYQSNTDDSVCQGHKWWAYVHLSTSLSITVTVSPFLCSIWGSCIVLGSRQGCRMISCYLYRSACLWHHHQISVHLFMEPPPHTIKQGTHTQHTHTKHKTHTHAQLHTCYIHAYTAHTDTHICPWTHTTHILIYALRHTQIKIKKAINNNRLSYWKMNCLVPHYFVLSNHGIVSVSADIVSKFVMSWTWQACMAAIYILPNKLTFFCSSLVMYMQTCVAAPWGDQIWSKRVLPLHIFW